jgi:cyanophycinase
LSTPLDPAPTRLGPPQPPPSAPRNPNRGLLIAIGGAEDKVGDRAVLREVIARAGGASATIALFPTASSIPEELAPLYETIFRKLGAEVRTVWIEERKDADDPENLRLLEGITAIFFTGGSQGRIVTMLGGTAMAQAIRRAHRQGVVVAGTSAGASVVCDHMIAQGKKGYAPRRASVTLAPGLGLTKRLVIDQHFAQRHRIGRLFAAVAMNPFLIGVGIDEDTAISLDAQNRLSVLGRGTVTIVDGARILHTDIHETPVAEPAALLGLSVHVLTRGCGFDIDSRVPTWAGQGPRRRDEPARAPIVIDEGTQAPALTVAIQPSLEISPPAPTPSKERP